MEEINFFAETNFRNIKRKFGIKSGDRSRHLYAIGKTGMGKTEMLKNMAVQDIQQGHGISFVDPHGEASDELLDHIPLSRLNDVIYFNPADIEYPIAFNVMEDVAPEYRHLVASGLMSVFKKIWPDVWSARMEYILNNAILALLECPGSTLLGINRMLADVKYRQEVVDQIRDPVIKTFWVQEYARYTQRYEVEATAAIQNKVGQFISNPLIRNIIGQTHSSINMREVMDGQKILIANISKGRIGEDNSRLLGALLITKLQLAAMSRVDMPEETRKDFFLYIDEFQNFATESFINILSEARKYGLSLILSHQYIAQLEEGVSEAVFGNVGTIVSFRIGAEDAEFLEKEFSPEFMATDFVNLGKYNIYVKLMIDGLASRPFSAETLEPISPLSSGERCTRENIIERSRERYGTPVGDVEKKIIEWAGVQELESKPQSAVSQSGEPQILYDATCSNCAKPTKVVFPPDGKRPIYCKSCRKKLKHAREQDRDSTTSQGKDSEREDNRQQTKQKNSTPLKEISLKDVAQKEPVLFHPSRSSKGRSGVKRKEVNTEELKKVLEEALEDNVSPVAVESLKEEKHTKPENQNRKNTPVDQEKKGVIEPGETIYF